MVREQAEFGDLKQLQRIGVNEKYAIILIPVYGFLSAETKHPKDAG